MLAEASPPELRPRKAGPLGELLEGDLGGAHPPKKKDLVPPEREAPGGETSEG